MIAIKKIIMIGLCAFFIGALNAQELPNISYAAYVNQEWQPSINKGEAGTVGKGILMEAFKIEVKSSVSGGITYSAYVGRIPEKSKLKEKRAAEKSTVPIGWQSWQEDGDFAGTMGQHLQIEAIKVKLTGNLAKEFDVLYRVHAKNIGWTEWADNGNVAGVAGQGLHIESFQVKLKAKE